VNGVLATCRVSDACLVCLSGCQDLNGMEFNML